MRYYDAARHWTKRILPHLGDKELNRILVRDFNKFTYGRWGDPFTPGCLPHEFESCSWWVDHRGKKPRLGPSQIASSELDILWVQVVPSAGVDNQSRSQNR